MSLLYSIAAVVEYFSDRRSHRSKTGKDEAMRISKGLLSTAALLLGTTVGLAPTAWADPPAPATLASFDYVMIVCDEEQFARELITTRRASKEAFGVKARELFEKTHVCTPARITQVVVGMSEDVGNVTWVNVDVHEWIMPFWDGNIVRWALYEEGATQAGNNI